MDNGIPTNQIQLIKWKNRHKLLKVTQEEMENMKIFTISKELKLEIKYFPQKKPRYLQ